MEQKPCQPKIKFNFSAIRVLLFFAFMFNRVSQNNVVSEWLFLETKVGQWVFLHTGQMTLSDTEMTSNYQNKD
jgi:hypothetical protein